MCDQKPTITRAGWVCPHCRTAYSPDVQMCCCSTVTPSLADRIGRGGYTWPGPTTRPAEWTVIC